jgi:pimeloyl-ACP methyl ester carboxylesterase
VFAHGLWADGSCFSKLIPPLQDEGYEVFASQHGLNSLESDVACVKRSLDRASGPVVLAGHSYGGTLITKAGTHDSVEALVYIAAFGPDEGETTQQHQEKYPATPIFGHLDVADGRIWLKPEAVPDFAGDLSEDDQKFIYATQAAPVADLFTQQVPGAAWKDKPSWYIVANNDRTINPDLERADAARMKAKMYDVDSSHVPMLSEPDFVLDVIRDAARAVEAKYK